MCLDVCSEAHAQGSDSLVDGGTVASDHGDVHDGCWLGHLLNRLAHEQSTKLLAGGCAPLRDGGCEVHEDVYLSVLLVGEV